jgi:hypothetical protein
MWCNPPSTGSAAILCGMMPRRVGPGGSNMKPKPARALPPQDDRLPTCPERIHGAHCSNRRNIPRQRGVQCRGKTGNRRIEFRRNGRRGLSAGLELCAPATPKRRRRVGRIRRDTLGIFGWPRAHSLPMSVPCPGRSNFGCDLVTSRQCRLKVASPCCGCGFLRCSTPNCCRRHRFSATSNALGVRAAKMTQTRKRSTSPPPSNPEQ